MGPSRAAAVAILMASAGTPAVALRLQPAPLATADAPAAFGYRVQPGDTLIGIGSRGLVGPRDWQVVAARNRVADPRRLPVGKRLAIPAALLRREPLTATIAAFSGQVAITPGGAARVGATVGAGTLLATGPNSFVTLAFADGSRITLPSQSQVRLAVLERIVLDGRLERRFELLSGRADFAVTPREREADRFLVRTPVAVAAVRGTEFRVAHLAAAATTIGVVDGSVAGRPAAARDDVAIPAGSGGVLQRDAIRSVRLLPAPALLDPGKVQDDPAVVLAMAPGGGTRRRVQLARDAGAIDIFAEAETDGDRVSFDGVGNGTLYARVTAIDADGVEGLAATWQFERFLSGLATEAGALPGTPRRTRFRWQPSGEGSRSYDFVLARDAALADRLVDAPALAGTEMTVSGLAPGSWYWRVTVTARDRGKRHVRVFPVQTLTIAR
ncbi:FecR domain-containing protein [Sandarakinorhabdus sp. DWP1-3-1]|uniref:FecR domain-containing protein n=1 Tax=Sandarakinorhabdus sp. DWP1-3-1 TaxID=2804627 RepID=UPI003CF6AA71